MLGNKSVVRKFWCIGVLALGPVLIGCQGSGNVPSPPGGANAGVMAGTIASYCEILGYNIVRVQGYSIVWGLAETGSRECPQALREYILRTLRKQQMKRMMGVYYAVMSAEEILQSLSTAVVFIDGWVPAGMARGARFDVEVTALSATQTTSLRGGRLLLADLRIVVPGYQVLSVAGRTVAAAQGPLFVNPFPLSPTQPQTVRADPRRGTVIGGGKSLLDRNVQLALLTPGYREAQQIQNTINARFTPTELPRAADAQSRSQINLRVPNAYADRHVDFLNLVMALYVTEQPGVLDEKLRALNAAAVAEDPDLESIALAWEGIGRNSLEGLRGFYRQKKGSLAFYAARTALNLGDRGAIEVLAEMATDESQPERLSAARALGQVVGDPTARKALLTLLDSGTEPLRLQAYESLREAPDGPVVPIRLPSGFWLDLVSSAGENMLCVWTQDTPRIVLFGRDFTCLDNIFYESEDKQVTINCRPNENEITIIRQLTAKTAITAKSGMTARDLIIALAGPISRQSDNKSRGAGLSYSEIVGILYHLCREDQRVIPARFKLHRRRADLTG